MNTSLTLKILAAVAIVFGALTVFSGGRALFGGAEAQAAVGNAVGFVLWFNFLAGFAYVLTGAGLWRAGDGPRGQPDCWRWQRLLWRGPLAFMSWAAAPMRCAPWAH